MKICYKNTVALVNTFLILGMLSLNVKAESFYYYDNFNAWTSDWVDGFHYGKEGVKIPDTESSTQYVSGGRFIVTGCPYDIHEGDWGYDGIWVGECARNEKVWSASAEAPFGFEIIRKNCELNHWQTDADEEPVKNWCDVGIWLVVDNGARALDEAFSDYIYFADHMRQNEEQAGLPARIGYFDGSQHDLELGSLTNFYGNLVNLTNRSIHSLEWDYNPLDQAAEPNTDSNTNWIGFRITHDGSKLSLWINTDPDDNDSYQNEWVKVETKTVAWNSGMKIMIGHNIRKRMLRDQHGEFDDLLIRSATDKSKASISPDMVPITPSAQKFVYTLENEIKPNNAGINIVRIAKPDVCQWVTDPVNDITVRNHYLNSSTQQILESVWLSSDEFPADNQVGIMTNGNEITLLLGSQITDMDRPEWENIYIDFDFIISDDFVSAEFTSSVEAIQLDSMPLVKKGKYSTCGEQKSSGRAVISPKKILDNIVYNK